MNEQGAHRGSFSAAWTGASVCPSTDDPGYFDLDLSPAPVLFFWDSQSLSLLMCSQSLIKFCVEEPHGLLHILYSVISSSLVLTPKFKAFQKPSSLISDYSAQQDCHTLYHAWFPLIFSISCRQSWAQSSLQVWRLLLLLVPSPDTMLKGAPVSVLPKI